MYFNFLQAQYSKKTYIIFAVFFMTIVLGLPIVIVLNSDRYNQKNSAMERFIENYEKKEQQLKEENKTVKQTKIIKNRTQELQNPVFKKVEKQPRDTGFILQDARGNYKDLSSFKGRYMLVTFGYSKSYNITHPILIKMSYLTDSIGTDKVSPVFITIDPKRDNRTVLAKKADRFHPEMSLLTGTKEQVDRVLYNYNIETKIENIGTRDYIIDYPPVIFLLDKDGKYLNQFLFNTPQNEIVDYIKGLV